MVIRMLSFVARVEFNWISALCTCCIEIVPVQRLSTYTQPHAWLFPSHKSDVQVNTYTAIWDGWHSLYVRTLTYTNRCNNTGSVSHSYKDAADCSAPSTAN